MSVLAICVLGQWSEMIIGRDSQGAETEDHGRDMGEAVREKRTHYPLELGPAFGSGCIGSGSAKRRHTQDNMRTHRKRQRMLRRDVHRINLLYENLHTAHRSTIHLQCISSDGQYSKRLLVLAMERLFTRLVNYISPQAHRAVG